MNITPGKTITVELVSRPRREAARKTLIRLFRRDAAVARHHRIQQRRRPSWEEWRRGNATWHHQMTTKPAVELEPGVKYRMRATLDVIRDLASVASLVKVS